jgi:formate hydrogenlyase subunit 4
MTLLAVVLHVVALLASPIGMVGVINRTKAIWAGRKGPPLLQFLFDLTRLLRKAPVYSHVTTPIFWIAPLVALTTALVSGLAVPLLGYAAPISFPFDFVAVAYLWGLGRVFVILAALDAGSSFEGLGASREATFGALVEPALFLCMGTLAAATGHDTFASIVHVGLGSSDRIATTAGCAIALFVVLQVESSRVPVDDPQTHLELTMIHEVMILDHSGPDLAALQYASAMKLTLLAALVAAVINPVPFQTSPAIATVTHLATMLVLALAVGCVESLVARLKLKALPQYIVVATVATFIALLATAWRLGSGG